MDRSLLTWGTESQYCLFGRCPLGAILQIRRFPTRGFETVPVSLLGPITAYQDASRQPPFLLRRECPWTIHTYHLLRNGVDSDPKSYVWLTGPALSGTELFPVPTRAHHSLRQCIQHWIAPASPANGSTSHDLFCSWCCTPYEYLVVFFSFGAMPCFFWTSSPFFSAFRPVPALSVDLYLLGPRACVHTYKAPASLSISGNVRSPQDHFNLHSFLSTRLDLVSYSFLSAK